MTEIETFRAEVRARLAEARANLERFHALSSAASCEALLAAFDAIGRPLNQVDGYVSLYAAVHPDPALRAAAEELEQELSTFRTELSLSRETYERLAALDPGAAPDDVSRRFLELSLRDYRRSGVGLDEGGRARVRALQEEIVRIGQEFDRNILEDVRRLELEEGTAALEGLPEDYRRSHRPGADGKVVLTTDPPDFLPFMTFAQRGDLRRRLFVEFTNRAWPENGEVLATLLAKRYELAQLLGYENWAAYVTEDKMVGSAQVAREFVQRVVGLAAPRMRAEYDELLAAKRAEEPGAEAICEWERLYWIERVKRSKHSFDSQEARPYFSFEAVLAGVLETSARLFGVSFRPAPERGVWHPSVRAYDLLEGERVVARAYFDLHPRPGKYKHAALFSLHSGVGETLPAACLVCNFPEPTADDPALLLHDQVTTFFHEVGHMLHQLFAGEARYLRFAGIATEWDFVEVPSQMYEEWAWDHGVLERFARHHVTGEPIPAELVARMRAAEEYGKALQVTLQMFYATFSLAFYDRDPSSLDVEDLIRELKARMLPFPHEEQSHFYAAFGHLHDYSAMYYTYMWSLVISKDLFTQFQADLFDPSAAERYRRAVLAPGGSKDARELVRDFLGRDYEFTAYQRWLEG